jgi:hypothetical protein
MGTTRSWSITSMRFGWVIAGAGSLVVLVAGALPWWRRDGADSWWGGYSGYDLVRFDGSDASAWVFHGGFGGYEGGGPSLPTGLTFGLAAAGLGIIVVFGAIVTSQEWWSVANLAALVALVPLAVMAFSLLAAADFFLKLVIAPGPGFLLVLVGFCLATWGIGVVVVESRREMQI